MAKKSSIVKNIRRRKLVEKSKKRRLTLKSIIMSKDSNMEIDEKIRASIKLSRISRDSSSTRVRNRCLLTGRPRGNYRDFGLSRIALRELSLAGLIPGVIKSSS